MKLKLGTPTYVYVIHCADLGLFYIGKHQGVYKYTDGNDGYFGSSPYLDAVRNEFTDFKWTKEFLAQFSTDDEALAFETEQILFGYETDPDGLLNRSPNNVDIQWVHHGYGTMKDAGCRRRLDKVRRILRPDLTKHLGYKNLILMKRADGTAHAPNIDTPRKQDDRTPFRNSRFWSKEMLAAYDAAPAGGIHFFCRVHHGFKRDGSRKIDYEPLHFVCTYPSQQKAREMSSHYAYLGEAEYVEAVLELFPEPKKYRLK